MGRISPSLDRVLARAGDGAFVVGADGRIVLWNRAAEKILGYSAHEVMGERCCDILVGADDKGGCLCRQGCDVMTRARRGEPIQHFDMRTRTKSGRPVWINVSTLVGEDGGRVGPLTTHLFRDVTATKELLARVNGNGGAPAVSSLTRRETEILGLMTLGLNTSGIAERLRVSPATVRNHVQNLFGKLGVHSRLEAVAHATNQRPAPTGPGYPTEAGSPHS